MSVPMIKHEGKMVPAKLVDGKYIPDTDAELHLTDQGLEAAPVGNSFPKNEPEDEEFGSSDFNFDED